MLGRPLSSEGYRIGSPRRDSNSEVADAPDIMGILKPADLKSLCGEVKSMNPLFVGIDASSKSNVVCLMKPDGTKFGTFSVQNNLGGTKILSEKNRVGAGRASTQRSEDRIGKNIGVALALIGLETSSMFQAAFVRALPHNESRTFVERFCRKTKFRKRRNTVCISSFLNCRIEAKDPAKVEDELCGIALKFLK